MTQEECNDRIRRRAMERGYTDIESCKRLDHFLQTNLVTAVAIKFPEIAVDIAVLFDQASQMEQPFERKPNSKDRTFLQELHVSWEGDNRGDIITGENSTA